MIAIPTRETLTVEFESDPPAGLSDKALLSPLSE